MDSTKYSTLPRFSFFAPENRRGGHGFTFTQLVELIIGNNPSGISGSICWEKSSTFFPVKYLRWGDLILILLDRAWVNYKIIIFKNHFKRLFWEEDYPSTLKTGAHHYWSVPSLSFHCSVRSMAWLETINLVPQIIHWYYSPFPPGYQNKRQTSVFFCVS